MQTKIYNKQKRKQKYRDRVNKGLPLAEVRCVWWDVKPYSIYLSSVLATFHIHQHTCRLIKLVDDGLAFYIYVLSVVSWLKSCSNEDTREVTPDQPVFCLSVCYILLSPVFLCIIGHPPQSSRHVYALFATRYITRNLQPTEDRVESMKKM